MKHSTKTGYNNKGPDLAGYRFTIGIFSFDVNHVKSIELSSKMEVGPDQEAQQ